jgi:hypothetical protein
MPEQGHTKGREYQVTITEILPDLLLLLIVGILWVLANQIRKLATSRARRCKKMSRPALMSSRSLSVYGVEPGESTA